MIEESTPKESTSTPCPEPSQPKIVFCMTGEAVIFNKRELSEKQLKEKLEREEKDPGSSRGPRCTEYRENSQARSKSRNTNLDGMRKKMRDLKITTNDDTLLVHYKDFGTPKQTEQKWATRLSLLDIEEPPVPVDGSTEPPAELLMNSSPTRTRTATRKWVCTVCGISFGTIPDKKLSGDVYEKNWLGCSYPLGLRPTCTVWNHKSCLGLIMPKNIQSVHWLCENHRKKPSNKRKLAATNK